MKRTFAAIALTTGLGLSTPGLFACAHDDLDERLEDRAEAHQERAEAYEEMGEAAERLEDLDEQEGVDDDEIERMREELEDALDD